MPNWFTRFFSWLFGGEEQESAGSDPNWRDAFAKYDPTFKGRIKEIYDGAESADAFFTGLEDLQISLELKIKEREDEKGDIDKEIFSFQEKVTTGEVDRAEEAKLLRRADRALMQAGKVDREVGELDAQYGMLMDFVTWLDEIVRKPEAAVEVNPVLWEKLRDGVKQRRVTFESSRAAWQEARKQIETGHADRMSEIRDRLMAYGKSAPAEEETPARPEKEDEALVKEKLLAYGAGEKKAEKEEPAAAADSTPEVEPEKPAEKIAEAEQEETGPPKGEVAEPE